MSRRGNRRIYACVILRQYAHLLHTRISAVLALAHGAAARFTAARFQEPAAIWLRLLEVCGAGPCGAARGTATEGQKGGICRRCRRTSGNVRRDPIRRPRGNAVRWNGSALRGHRTPRGALVGGVPRPAASHWLRGPPLRRHANRAALIGYKGARPRPIPPPSGRREPVTPGVCRCPRPPHRPSSFGPASPPPESPPPPTPAPLTGAALRAVGRSGAARSGAGRCLPRGAARIAPVTRRRARRDHRRRGNRRLSRSRPCPEPRTATATSGRSQRRVGPFEGCGMRAVRSSAEWRGESPLPHGGGAVREDGGETRRER